LDSIAQAAGRCNREGRLGVATELDPRTNLPLGGLVRVFAPPKLPSPRKYDKQSETPTLDGLVALRCGINATIELFDPETPFDGTDPEIFKNYFATFYYNCATFDEPQILKALTNGVCKFPAKGKYPSREPEMKFRTVGEKFQMIEDLYSQTVYVRYGKGAEYIDELRATGARANLLRKLQKYSVNLPRNVVDELVSLGRIEKLTEDSNVYFQTDARDYDEIFGYNVYRKREPWELLEI